VEHAELAEDVGDVGLDRALAQVEVGGELGVALAGGQQAEHFELAFGQVIEPVVSPGRSRVPGVVLDHSACDRRGEQRLAGRHDAHRADELLGSGVLEHEAAGARS
jgi:hypothetical protein